MFSNPSLAVVRHLLYNHNPFYVISAVLVLCGVWRSVAGQDVMAAGWPMFALLGSYIVLLAAAAWAIIRLGGVWQDARTLLVVIVLMLVALSMSFDAIAVLDPAAARWLLLGGLALATAVSEGTLRGLGIRLSWLYRGPYYAVLALLFAYPLWLGELLHREQATLRAWSLMLFPALAGAVFLGLLPAARWGRSQKWAAGAPWPWPLFPWTLFFFLALGVGVRSYSLAFAFETGAGGESGFRWFWLAPLIVACSLLTLEMGLSARHRLTQTLATLAPLTLVPLALAGPGENAMQAHFQSLLQATLAGPALLMVGLLIAFYSWAWLRRARFAEAGLLAALAVAAVVDSATVDVQTLAPLNAAPLGVVLVLQVALSLRNGASWRMLLAAILAIAAGCWTTPDVPLVRSGYVPLHAFVLTALAMGLTFEDAFARRLRAAAPYLLPGLALLAVAAYPLLFPQAPLAIHAGYVAGLAALAVLYWRRERDTPYLAAALGTTSLVAAAGLRTAYAQLDGTPLAAGRDWLAAGLACLAVGLFISLAKGGVLRNLWTTLVAWNQRLQSPA